MDGATDIIDALAADQAAGGSRFRLAVGSSAPPENIDLCLEKLARRTKFSAVVTGKDVTRGKPDPQVFLLAAERLGVPAASCAVVEDAVHGIEAANRAGMKSIGLVGTVPREKLAAADLIIDSLNELSPEVICDLIGNSD
jgi:beta-phosphoglucomutase-like phosphatase (HAD superfamily)